MGILLIFDLIELLRDHHFLTNFAKLIWQNKNLATGGWVAATSASMFCPASRACSHRMIWATPSMKILTSSTSDFPRRSAFEISQVPPVEAESTPAVPRAWSPMRPRTALKSLRAEKRGTLKLCVKSWIDWLTNVLTGFVVSLTTDSSAYNNKKFSFEKPWPWHQHGVRFRG